MRVMDRDWLCPLCDDPPYAQAKDLAAHLVAWHDEWLTGHQVPPQ